MGIARSRINDESRAEDAVQETLLAVLRNKNAFEGRSAYRTWLTGILLNKIHDGYRSDARERALFTRESAEDEDTEGRYFDGAGAWLVEPSAWADPERVFEGKRFRAAFARAIEKLPARQREAFLLREIAGLESPAICELLGVTASNLFVLLHRARLALRELLEHEGFGEGVAGGALT